MKNANGFYENDVTNYLNELASWCWEEVLRNWKAGDRRQARLERIGALFVMDLLGDCADGSIPTE